MIAHFQNKKKSEGIIYFLRRIMRLEKEIIIFCVGTDRCTGDSLGPIVGTKLKEKKIKDFIVYGDLENPIHAKNLNESVKEAKKTHPHAFIIAVDATLGDKKDVGYIFVKQGPIDAGSALSKTLEPVGDMHIGGIVNSMEGNVVDSLQNTRLYFVMEMAEYIVDILVKAKETTIFQ